MKHLRILLSIALALAVAPFWGASAAEPDAALVPGDTFTWEGAATPGANVNYHDNFGTGVAEVDGPVRGVAPVGVCSDDATTYCETFLVSFTNPVPEADADGKLTKTANVALTNAKGDVDLLVYASDAEGTKGAEIGSSAGPGPSNTTLDENLGVPVVTTRPTLAKPTQADAPTKFFLVEVVYYHAAGYTGTIRF